MIQDITFKYIDGLALTLSKLLRRYSRLLAEHCQAAYDNAQQNMKSFSLLPNNLKVVIENCSCLPVYS